MAKEIGEIGASLEQIEIASGADTQIESNAYEIPTIFTLNDIDEHDNNDYSLNNLKDNQTHQACLDMEEFLTSFIANINSLAVNIQTKDRIFSSYSELIRKVHELNVCLLNDNNGMNAVHASSMSTDFVCKTFKRFETKYKRDKHFETNDKYVAPEEMAMGLRWDLVRVENVPVPRLIPCKFQYVSIIETIKSLFSREDFRCAASNLHR